MSRQDASRRFVPNKSDSLLRKGCGVLFDVILVMSLSMKSCTLLCVLFFECCCLFAQKKTLDSRFHHLRKGINREWSEFPVRAKDSILELNFSLVSIPTDACLLIRQYDVNQSWMVSLNGKKLGELVIDEKDMLTPFQIPPGTLKRENNQLKISSTVIGINSDDIKVGQIEFFTQSSKQLLSEAHLDVEIRDKSSNEFLPSRLTIVDQNKSLRPIDISPADDIAFRTGIIYTGKGRISFNLAAGNYTIYASRGFEYGIDSFKIALKSGSKTKKTLFITREVETDGWVSCDPHIHTLTYSGHGDATFKERLLTIAGEGLEFPVFTEHNRAVEVVPEQRRLQLESYFTPVTGNELTTKVGHFNIFPVRPGTLTAFNANNWDSLYNDISKTDGIKAIILNHARDIHNDFRPFDPKQHLSQAGMDLHKWNFPANAMEVVNSGSQQTDQFQLHRDWFGMLNRGYSLTAVGSSDSHDVNRFLVGQARTYIECKDKDPSKINRLETIENFVEGRTLMSFGLYAEIKVNDKYGPGDIVPTSGKISVSIRVQGPSWTSANKISLYANGVKIKEAIINKTRRSTKYVAIWDIPKFQHDVFLVAIAEGPAVKFPFWQIAKPFQHTSPDWNPKIIGSTGVIRIDADGDGKFTSAYYYAKQLWESSNGNFNSLFKSLNSYDEAVIIQTAAVLTEAGFDVTNREISLAIAKAGPRVKKGFQIFIHELKTSRLF